jgi:hypothetical protein
MAHPGNKVNIVYLYISLLEGNHLGLVWIGIFFVFVFNFCETQREFVFGLACWVRNPKKSAKAFGCPHGSKPKELGFPNLQRLQHYPVPTPAEINSPCSRGLGAEIYGSRSIARKIAISFSSNPSHLFSPKTCHVFYLI